MFGLIHRPTRDKLTLGFGLVLLCLAMVTLLACQSLRALQQSQEHLARTEMANAEALSSLRSQVNGMQATVLTMMSQRSQPGKEAWHQEARRYTDEARATMRQLLRRLSEGARAPSLATASAAGDFASRDADHDASRDVAEGAEPNWDRHVSQLATLLGAFERTQDRQVIPLIYRGDLEGARHFTLYIQTERFLKIAALTEAMTDQAQNQAHLALQESGRRARRTLMGFAALGAFTLLLSVGLVFWLNRSIAGPLSAVSGAASRIAAGDFSVQVRHQERRDEIGVLMHTFNQMSSSLREITAVADQIAGGNPNVKIQPRSERDVLGKAFAALDFQAEALRQKNALMEADINLAREIQQALLPLHFRAFAAPGAGCALGFAHHYESSSALGGDFFDIWELSSHEVGVFVCDVMGHGVRSALVTAVLRGLLEELRGVASEPGRFLSEVNRSLVAILQHTRTPLFATAFYLVADVSSGQWRYANAGHPRPFWLRGARGEAGLLPQSDEHIGPALGVFSDATYLTASCAFEARDRLLLATDGLIEAANAAGEEYGEERLLDWARAHLDATPSHFFQTLLDDARSFSGQSRFEDDVCLVDVEVRAAK